MNPSIPAKTYRPTSVRGLRTIGALGSVLAFTILGASILLRLSTHFGVDGIPQSNLPLEYENAIRMVHRLSASSLGLLALVAAIFCWIRRSSLPQAVQPVVWMVAATVLLALIGPLTPGYRYSSVTIANVVAGTVLLAACWWLREALSTTAPITLTQRPIIRVTLAIFVLHVSLGAASSDSQMRGIHWVAFVHSGSAMLTALLLGSILWDHRKNAQSARMVVAMACLLAIQLVLGLVSIWMAARPIGLDFVHAMLSPLLLAGLVSLNLKDGLQENSL
jgi:heme A synthase